MHCVVEIPEISAILSLMELPDDSLGLNVVEGGWIEVPPDIADWPIGTDRPPPRTLAVCETDPKHYRLFKFPDEVERAGFRATGMTYWGAYSPTSWKRFTEKLPSIKAFYAIPDDPPDAMEAATRYLREAR